ncbi:hypothetical protein [Aureimonas jatrophae]|uniref:Uncharacterized protein n=1 Tax=Aureimonas jatrophae TaxID=1166073 RepID=A0A1H0K9D1_9HYPH|nr:hypothetical protein [Aureimonas jatrophae]MBB3951010.1 hypothetical protein [Aureimonas jatrophae]SDO52517.1 hypothetical protein SAMN05192530_107158 [Aureimonas jatrophae]
MRSSIRIASERTPTSWLLDRELARQLGHRRIVGRHVEGDDWSGLVHLAIEDGDVVSAAVCLYDRVREADGTWLETKVISEAERPYATSYPIRLLDMLSPPRAASAVHWRNCCMALACVPALDDRPIRSGESVFLACSSTATSDAALPGAILRWLSVAGGTARVVEVDPATGRATGSVAIDVVTANLRRARFPVVALGDTVAHELHRRAARTDTGFGGPGTDVRYSDIFGGRCWEADGRFWKVADVNVDLGIGDAAGDVPSGRKAMMLTFRTPDEDEPLRTTVAFGPSGEAVVVAVEAPVQDMIDFVRDLERCLNMPPEPCAMAAVEPEEDGECSWSATAALSP